MEETKGYPKLQWSVFVKNGKDCQYVVRADTFEEFVLLKNQVLAEVAKDLIASGANVTHTVQAPVSTQPSEPANVSTPTCTIHNVTMKERIGKNGGKWNDHRQLIDGVWNKCNGSGWKS